MDRPETNILVVDDADAVRYGIFDYLLKPFNVPEILSRIERASCERLN